MWFGWDYSDTFSDATASTIANLTLLAWVGWMSLLIGYAVVILIRGPRD